MSHNSSQRKGELALRAFRGSSVSFFYQDVDLEIAWVENPPGDLAAGDLVGKTDEELCRADIAMLSILAKREAMRDRARREIEVPLTLSGEESWYEIQIEPDIGRDGTVSGVSARPSTSPRTRGASWS